MTLKSFLLLLFFILSACAGTHQPSELKNNSSDPFEPFNRAVFSFNTVTDEYVFRPVINSYRYLVPKPTRTGVSNIFDNINEPISLSNNLLQGHFKRAGITTARIIINTIAGFFGAYDVAEKWGFPKEKTGFSDTLGVWGVPSGPYLVLPFFGPSDIRSATGLGVDIFLNPMTYTAYNRHKKEVSYFFNAEVALGAIIAYDNAVDLLDDLKKNSLDFYVATRSMYQQYRDARIRRLSTDSSKEANEDVLYEFSLDDE